MGASPATLVLNTLTNDPNGWFSEVNRFQARLIIELRALGVSDETIYAAILAAD